MGLSRISQALELASRLAGRSPGERAAALRALKQGDPELARLVACELALPLEDPWLAVAELPRDFGARYRLEEELGAGGMGRVYRATDRRLDRSVAIKLLKVREAEVDPREWDALRARFEREARAVARLDHPGLAVVHDHGVIEGTPYICMQLVSGRSLDRLGSFDLIQAARITHAVAEVIGYAHEQGVIHRDLKPANIMIEAGGRARVLDFGLARVGAASSQSQAGLLMGTPAYMSPEQIAAEPDRIGPPADIYALGGVLFHLLTGRPPFQCASPFGLLAQVTSQAPPAPSALDGRSPPALDRIVLRCLAKDPAERFQSAGELAGALSRYLGGGALGKAVHARGRGRLSVWSIALTAAVLAGVALWITSRRRLPHALPRARLAGLVELPLPDAPLRFSSGWVVRSGKWALAERSATGSGNNQTDPTICQRVGHQAEFSLAGEFKVDGGARPIIAVNAAAPPDRQGRPPGFPTGLCLYIGEGLVTLRVPDRRTGSMTTTPYLDRSRKPVPAGVWHRFRLQSAGQKLRARVWRSGEPEPPGWDVSGRAARREGEYLVLMNMVSGEARSTLTLRGLRWTRPH